MFKILNSNLEPKPDCSSLPTYYMCHYVWKEGIRRSKKREGKEDKEEEGQKETN